MNLVKKTIYKNINYEEDIKNLLKSIKIEANKLEGEINKNGSRKDLNRIVKKLNELRDMTENCYENAKFYEMDEVILQCKKMIKRLRSNEKNLFRSLKQGNYYQFYGVYMNLLKNLFKNNNTKTEQEITQIQNEEYVSKMKNNIITILKIAESQICYTKSKIENYNTLLGEEIEYLYDNLNSMKRNIEISKEFAIKNKIQNFISKADEILDKLENLKTEFNGKIIGIVY